MSDRLAEMAIGLYAKLGGAGSADARIVRGLLEQRNELLAALEVLEAIVWKPDRKLTWEEWVAAVGAARAAIHKAKGGDL